MASRLISRSATAVFALALLSGCSLLPGFSGDGGATVDSGDVANAAEDWLEDDEDIKYSVECEDEEVTLAEDASVDCVATDRDTDLAYDVEITITNVDGEDFEVEVDRDSDARSEDDSDDADSDDSATDDVFSLVVGDCFNDAAVGLESDEPVNSVDIVDCNEAHEREVYAAMNFDGDDDEYPGETSVTDEADVFCLDEWEGFVGIPYDNSTLYFLTFYPTEDSWSEGDREVLCLISEYDENDDVVKVEGSLEGSER